MIFNDKQKSTPLHVPKAAELSGFPERTLWDWIRKGHLTTTTKMRGKRQLRYVTIGDIFKASVAARKSDKRRGNTLQ